MNCYFCNCKLTNGIIQNGKSLCVSCSQKINSFNNSTAFTKSTKPPSQLYACKQCKTKTMTIESSGYGCITGKGVCYTEYNCTNCGYHHSETIEND